MAKPSGPPNLAKPDRIVQEGGWPNQRALTPKGSVLSGQSTVQLMNRSVERARPGLAEGKKAWPRERSRNTSEE